MGTPSHNAIAEKTPFSGVNYWMAALFLIFVWGSAFNMIEVALDYISVLWLVSYRLIIATLLLVGYVIISGKRFPPLRDKRWLWYIGLGLTGMTIYSVSAGEFFLIINSALGAPNSDIGRCILLCVNHHLNQTRPGDRLGRRRSHDGIMCLNIRDFTGLSQ